MISKWINNLRELSKRKDIKGTLLGNTLVFLKWLRRAYYNLRLVNWLWFLNLKLKNAFSDRIKVGFGPIVTGEHTLSNRKWHIDPQVNYINKYSKKYFCDVFFHGDDLSKFGIIVSVKNFDDISQEVLEQLKRNNKILIYDICDNPLGCKKNYLKEPRFIKSINGTIINNPLQRKNIQHLNSNFRLIELPVINVRHKKKFKKKGPVNILWEGFAENMEFTTNKINPIIKRLAKESNCKINMIYHSNIPSRNEGVIKYVKWRLSNWENMLVTSDIAVVIKPADNELQQRKPSTKINTYRTAGLPVVCMPSEADKLVIAHGKTGYFAYTDEDWYNYLKKLIESPELREEIGKAGRKYVIENFSIAKVAQKYIDFFDELIATREQIARSETKCTV